MMLGQDPTSFFPITTTKTHPWKTPQQYWNERNNVLKK